MEGSIEFLEEKLNQEIDYYKYDTNYQDDTYNWLAIGNSLTMIESWGRGICSTYPDGDYVGIVCKELKAEYGSVIHYAYNFSPWERAGNRDTTLELLDRLLSDKLNLISIQLGENASDLSTYEGDLEKLISYCKEKAPKAQIVVICDWWSIERNELRKQAALSTGCNFADLSEIIGDKEYQSKEGLVYYLVDGSSAIVPANAATHPGDEGFRYIATKIIKEILAK